MKIIEYIYGFRFWQFLLRGLFIFSALSIILALIGLIIAIPTDHGRHFFFVSLYCFYSVYFALILQFPIIRIVMKLKKTESIFEKLNYRIKFRHHENWNKYSNKNQYNDNEFNEEIKL